MYASRVNVDVGGQGQEMLAPQNDHSARSARIDGGGPEMEISYATSSRALTPSYLQPGLLIYDESTGCNPSQSTSVAVVPKCKSQTECPADRKTSGQDLDKTRADTVR